VHGAAFAARNAIPSAEKLAGHTAQVPSLGEIMSVRTVGREYFVFGAELTTHADRNCFLTDIEMDHAEYFLVQIQLNQFLFRNTHEEHSFVSVK